MAEQLKQQYSNSLKNKMKNLKNNSMSLNSLVTPINTKLKALPGYKVTYDERKHMAQHFTSSNSIQFECDNIVQSLE